jgi:hypothetical protein
VTLLLAVLLAQVDGGTLITAPRQPMPGGTVLRGPELVTTARDPARAFQQAPGVARTSPGSSDVVLWGAAPGESRFFIEEVEVPSLLHLGGWRSLVAPSLVGRLEVALGAFRADTGRALGGVVKLGLAELRPGAHAEATVDLTNASGFASLGSERVRGSLSGDVSLVKAVFEPLLQGLARDRYPLPSSFDLQGRLSLAPTDNDTVELLALGSSDASQQQVASADPSLTRGQQRTQWFARLGTTWRHGGAEEGFSISPFVGVDRQERALVSAVGQASSSEQRWTGGVRARARGAVTGWLSVQYGADSLVARSTFTRGGPPTFPPREGDVVAFGEPISNQLAVDAWRTTAVDAAVWGTAELSLGPVTVSPGLRLSVVSSDVSRGSVRIAATPPLGLSSLELLLEPRGRVSWTVVSGLVLSAAAGLTHQAPDGADQSVVFGTPALLSAHGAHAALEASVVAGLFAGDLTGFWRGSQGLAVRDPSALPGVTSALLATGEGRAFGGQLELRQRAWHGLSSSLTWTMSRSERRATAITSWRLSDVDQPHTLVATVTWQPDAWRFGARARWASGAPRTAVIGSYLDARLGVSDPVFGLANGVRLPDFLQVDLDASYTFHFGPGSLELFLSVLNVTNRRNVEEFVWDSTWSTRGALLGLPLLGTLGLRGAW